MNDFKTVFYRKIGRKYIPAAEYDGTVMHSMPYGAHLVVVERSSQSRRYQIDPDWAALTAAAHYAENDLINILVDVSKARPSAEPLTSEQIAAWKALNKSFDNQISLLYPSAASIARDFLSKLEDRARELLQNPTVKSAYEQFLLAVELTRQNQQDK